MTTRKSAAQATQESIDAISGALVQLATQMERVATTVEKLDTRVQQLDAGTTQELSRLASHIDAVSQESVHWARQAGFQDKLAQLERLIAAQPRSPSMASPSQASDDEVPNTTPEVRAAERLERTVDPAAVPLPRDLPPPVPNAPGPGPLSASPVPRTAARTQNIRAVPRPTSNGIAVCSYEDLSNDPVPP